MARITYIDGSNKNKPVHRLVAEAFGLDISQTIDHIDGNKCNNRLDNLRSCSSRENVNYHYKRNPLHRGVYAVNKAVARNYNNKYMARISVEGKNVYLGYYPNEEAAYRAITNYERAREALAAGGDNGGGE